VERLRAAGYVVNQVIALVDREQGGAEFYRSVNLDFHSIFQISTLKTRYQQIHS